MAEWPSFLKKMRKGGEVSVGDSCSVPTLESLQNLVFMVNGLLKTYLVQHLSSDDTCSHQGSPPVNQNRFSLVRLPRLKAYSGVLLDNKRRYPFSILLVKFAQKEQTAKLNGLVREN